MPRMVDGWLRDPIVDCGRILHQRERKEQLCAAGQAVVALVGVPLKLVQLEWDSSIGTISGQHYFAEM